MIEVSDSRDEAWSLCGSASLRSDTKGRERMRRRDLLGSIGALAVAAPRRSAAQARETIRIGVLGDRTGIGAAASGPSMVEAVKLAVADVDASAAGRSVEIVNAEYELRPDFALAIARKWFDEDHVNVIVDVPGSAASEAVQELARARNKTLIVTSSVSDDLTGRSCAAIGSQWSDDTYALTTALARSLASGGARTWYLVGPDTLLGLTLQRDASKAIEAAGGRVLGTARHPALTTEFGSILDEAAKSGAQVIGLAGIGPMLADQVSQARKLGLFNGDRVIAALLAYITDIDTIGLESARGLHFVDGFYWDQNEQTRSFGRRFQAVTSRMPDQPHAAAYAAIRHYLRAIISADTIETAAVNVEMRRTPVYFFGRTGRIRIDGRVVLDLTLYKAKSPDQSAQRWDYLEPVKVIPGGEAFRPQHLGGCPLAP